MYTALGSVLVNHHSGLPLGDNFFDTSTFFSHIGRKSFTKVLPDSVVWAIFRLGQNLIISANISLEVAGLICPPFCWKPGKSCINCLLLIPKSISFCLSGIGDFSYIDLKAVYLKYPVVSLTALTYSSGVNDSVIPILYWFIISW